MTDEHITSALGQLRAHLVAAQSVTEVAIAMLDGLAAQVATAPEPEVPDPDAPCSHPEDARLFPSPMGAGAPVQTFCSICGEEVPSERHDAGTQPARGGSEPEK